MRKTILGALLVPAGLLISCQIYLGIGLNSINPITVKNKKWPYFLKLYLLQFIIFYAECIHIRMVQKAQVAEIVVNEILRLDS